MRPLAFLDDEISQLQASNILRVRASPPPRNVTIACTNDYLGYANRNNDPTPVGATGSRLIVGDHPSHLALETELAAWLHQPAALLFTSGFAANLGVLSALPREGDIIVSMSLNHASIIDGCRLSRASVHVVPFTDFSAIEQALSQKANHKWLVTESYFSMDGLCPDLCRLRQLCDQARAALIVDEAHALGVFGPTGAGLCEQQQVRADLVIGTLGKAIGVQGAFGASTDAAILWLWNRARSFVYSTGMSPLLTQHALTNVARARIDRASRETLHRNTQRFRENLARAQVPVVEGSVGPIVPIIAGASAHAVEMEQKLLERGFLVRAIRPPTVPEGTARLRVTITAAMTDSQLDDLASALQASQ